MTGWELPSNLGASDLLAASRIVVGSCVVSESNDDGATTALLDAVALGARLVVLDLRHWSWLSLVDFTIRPGYSRHACSPTARPGRTYCPAFPSSSSRAGMDCRHGRRRVRVQSSTDLEPVMRGIMRRSGAGANSAWSGGDHCRSAPPRRPASSRLGVVRPVAEWLLITCSAVTTLKTVEQLSASGRVDSSYGVGIDAANLHRRARPQHADDLLLCLSALERAAPSTPISWSSTMRPLTTRLPRRRPRDPRSSSIPERGPRRRPQRRRPGRGRRYRPLRRCGRGRGPRRDRSRPGAFTADPELAAVFGSYDARPRHPGVISRIGTCSIILSISTATRTLPRSGPVAARSPDGV